MDDNHVVTNDLQDGFQLNQLNLDEKFGLSLAGKPQPAGTYSAAGFPKALKGTGLLMVVP
jgi:hypothetical protein